MKYYVFYPDKPDIGTKLEAANQRAAAAQFFAQHPRSDDRLISVVPRGIFGTVVQFRTSDFLDDRTRQSIAEVLSPSDSYRQASRQYDFGGSLVLSAVLFGYDAVLTGSFLMTFLIGPIWLLVAIIKALIRRSNWSLSLYRIATPLVTMGLVFANAWLQSKVARSHAELIIQASKQYQQSHGNFPPTLDALVPEYLRSVPSAKYCLVFGNYWYTDFEGRHDLMWVEIPPFGRPYYLFEEARWGYLD
jgi:hypothetical protein